MAEYEENTTTTVFTFMWNTKLYIYLLVISNWKWPFNTMSQLTIGLLPTSSIFRYCQFSIFSPKMKKTQQQQYFVFLINANGL
jgi:hypothetical protein